MSSDITSSAPKKKAAKPDPAPVWVWTPALDRALDDAETQWLTTMQFARDERFAVVVEDEHGTTRRPRHPSGLQHAVDRNLFGLWQSRRAVRVQVRCRGGHVRSRSAYAYPLWRILRWLGLEDERRPPTPPPPSRGPLRQSVQFTSPTPQEEEAPPPPPPHSRAARDLMFIPPPAQPQLEMCGADSC